MRGFELQDIKEDSGPIANANAFRMDTNLREESELLGRIVDGLTVPAAGKQTIENVSKMVDQIHSETARLFAGTAIHK